MTIEKYSPTMRLLHWLMAIIIIGLTALGIYMTGLDKSPFKFELYGLHKSFGAIALALIALRIVLRRHSRIPELPAALSSTEQQAAHWGHRALYALMVIMPVSGYVMSAAHPERYGAWLFGYRLPDLPASEFWAGLMHQIHSFAGYLLVAVLVAHIAGALKHRYWDSREADVLPRMLY
jgi:cytochrome b561